MSKTTKRWMRMGVSFECDVETLEDAKALSKAIVKTGKFLDGDSYIPEVEGVGNPTVTGEVDESEDEFFLPDAGFTLPSSVKVYTLYSNGEDATFPDEVTPMSEASLRRALSLYDEEASAASLERLDNIAENHGLEIGSFEINITDQLCP